MGVFFVEFFLKIVINWYSFSKLCDCRSFYDNSQNMWSTITHTHDRWNWVKKYLRSLMIVIWSEMIGDHDPISPTLVTSLIITWKKTSLNQNNDLPNVQNSRWSCFSNWQIGLWYWRLREGDYITFVPSYHQRYQNVSPHIIWYFKLYMN